MTNKEIFDLIGRFEGSCLQSMKLSSGDFSLELTKAAACADPASAPAVGGASVAAPEVSGDELITAPLVGVYYAASEPGGKPFVQVGDRVAKGQTLCLMEAMKTLSEVPAPCDCVITGVLKENGDLTAFQEPLFRYQPC